MKKQKLFWLIPLSLILILSMLAGCGSTSSSDMSSVAVLYNNEKYEYAEESFDEDGMMTDAAEPGSEYGTDTTVLDASVERKLTYRADVGMETKTYHDTLEALEKLVGDLGGYISSSTVSDYGEDTDRTYARSAEFEVMVPAASLDDFLGKLKEIGNVLNVSKQVEDITTSYYDAQAKLSSLLEEEQRLSALQDKAETLDELLTIEEYLSSVRSEINYLHSIMQLYEKQIAYSTVSISLNEVLDYTPVPVQDPTLGERIAEAFTDSLDFFSEVGQGLIVALVFMLPVLILIAVIVVVIIVCVKAGQKKRARRRAGQQGNPAPVQTPDAQPVSLDAQADRQDNLQK